jgi:hypothetical protein
MGRTGGMRNVSSRTLLASSPSAYGFWRNVVGVELSGEAAGVVRDPELKRTFMLGWPETSRFASS